MPLLVGVAFVAGIVTALSPCVLPVLPVVLAGGATGSERRPYAIVAGLVASFTVFTLTAATLLSALGLPEDLLRNLAIGVVALVGLSLVWPWLGERLGRPFYGLARRPPGDVGGGFLLGASLGLLFTPCAGPVIGAVATIAATESLSPEAFLITLSYALGAGAVLLAVAVAARRSMTLPSLRTRAPTVRRVLGTVILGVAVLMALGIDTDLQTRVPAYTRSLQALEESQPAQSELDELVGRSSRVDRERLDDFGPAPEFRGIDRWINSEPLSLERLRGKVVLVDFWTYSCINCLRTLAHLRSWYEAYRDDELVIVGVHSPEFAFEHDEGNVRSAVDRLGIEYPVALDNDFETWTAWSNRYWPAKYFVDRLGHVRYVHVGEGDYEESERVLRRLLSESPDSRLVSAEIPDETPADVETPETYLGYERLFGFVGSRLVRDRESTYVIPGYVPLNGVAYGGRWTVEGERIVAGAAARLRLAFHAKRVHLVLGSAGGDETVEVSLDGRALRPVHVTRDDLYTLAVVPDASRDHVLDLRFSPGTEAYAFTFG
ncbi:MAG TPA: cytochrome c biogenesis protein DipZ [Gaiellaceae bacterium]|jgi:cytochrome c biogenesis protein CcdA/thiol-disulfide isomerase/thioredoxin